MSLGITAILTDLNDTRRKIVDVFGVLRRALGVRPCAVICR
jgi:hypothetical protein